MQYKRCSKCHALKSVDEFYIRHSTGLPRSQCKKCDSEQFKNWYNNNIEYNKERNRKNNNQIPMDKNKDCSSFLGVHVAERVLSYVFNNVEVMPYGNPGYDFICGKGYKIDVKSSCFLYRGINAYKSYFFNIKKNTIPDYFLLIGFNDRQQLQPSHLWIVPSNIINNKSAISITDKTLNKWKQYEHSVDNIIMCCNKLKTSI